MLRPLEDGGRQWWDRAQQPKLGRMEPRSSRLLRRCRSAGRPAQAQQLCALLPLPLGRAKGEKRTRTMKVGKYPDVQKKLKKSEHTVCYFTSVFPRMHVSPGSIPLYKWHTDHIRGTEMGPRFRSWVWGGVGGQLPWRVILLLPLVGRDPSPQTWLQYHLPP